MLTANDMKEILCGKKKRLKDTVQSMCKILTGFMWAVHSFSFVQCCFKLYITGRLLDIIVYIFAHLHMSKSLEVSL